MLSRKLVKIQRAIDFLNDQKPVDVEDASLRSRRSQENDEQNGPQIEPGGAVSLSSWTTVNSAGEKNVEEKTNTHDYAGFDDITLNARHSISTSFTESSSPKALVRSFSYVPPFSSKASFIRERWQQSKLIYNGSSDEQEL
ncbi:Uncharacterized protein Adt_04156 [Abeliophyllum distichum]|uniref:Uncharacterized protein n=1 Tax=Abeliophyllum distichum TaxID=126358 RepID=A0ABD1W0J2_9LAMI